MDAKIAIMLNNSHQSSVAKLFDIEKKGKTNFNTEMLKTRRKIKSRSKFLFKTNRLVFLKNYVYRLLNRNEKVVYLIKK
ncbi:MAG: hypothetical protein HeimC3_21480 [Candidatus Heimdallarchaeota archaeon LC_3]|nr:MAG: hypothetical protein HeimC3_21480 [Candidatus Heimdallarchaeota archaeon LC_3]